MEEPFLDNHTEGLRKVSYHYAIDNCRIIVESRILVERSCHSHVTVNV